MQILCLLPRWDAGDPVVRHRRRDAIPISSARLVYYQMVIIYTFMLHIQLYYTSRHDLPECIILKKQDHIWTHYPRAKNSKKRKEHRFSRISWFFSRIIDVPFVKSANYRITLLTMKAKRSRAFSRTGSRAFRTDLHIPQLPLSVLFFSSFLSSAGRFLSS